MNGIAVVQFGAIIYFSIYIKLCFFILITLPSVLIPSWPILPTLAWDHNIMVLRITSRVDHKGENWLSNFKASASS